MKKYTVLAAAIAMVAFAGCNKEENNTLPVENGLATFTMTGESYSSADKQSYNARDRHIVFTQDEACYANGYYAPLTLLDPATQGVLTDANATSRIARISIPAEYASLPFTVLYPASAFVEGAPEDFPLWNCRMDYVVECICEDLNSNSPLDEFTSSWPMAAVVSQGGRGSFQLRNCVAILTPTFKFNEAFVNRLAERFPEFVYDRSMAANTTMEIFLINMVSNVPLSGDAHVDFSGEYPTLVMDSTYRANNTLGISSNFYDMNTVWSMDTTDNSVEHVLGNVAVAPMHAGNTLRMDVIFTITVGGVMHAFEYKGNTVTLDETPGSGRSVLRSMRTTISADFATASGADKVEMTF